jgi:hypothetical protein
MQTLFLRTLLFFAPLVLAAAVLPSAAAAGTAGAAYFKVTLAASQDVRWKANVTYRTCDGGTVDYQGSGTAAMRVHTARANLADALLRGTAGSDPQHSSAGGLPLAKLFGHAHRFTVAGHSHETVQSAGGAVVVSGTRPVTTTTHWTMTFTRLMHRPRGL